MSAKPNIPHHFECNPKGSICLVPYIHEPFIRLMDAIYPRLVSGSTARKGEGYSAFLMTGFKPIFIGSFTGMCVASVRKNPWFEDEGQWFLRALLGGMHAAHTEHDHRSRCHHLNYGTLRLWDKLGLGAKLTTRGDYISVTRDEASHLELQTALVLAKQTYGDIRAEAKVRMDSMSIAQIAALLPPERLTLGEDAFRVNVELIP